MANQHTVKKNIPPQIETAPLVAIAHELAGVKRQLPLARAKVLDKCEERDAAIHHEQELIARHKELQEKLSFEALLVKPE
jgi:hypothetical protein